MNTHYSENSASYFNRMGKGKLLFVVLFALNNMQSYVMCYAQKLQFDIRFAM